MRLFKFKIPFSKIKRIYLRGYWHGYDQRISEEKAALENMSTISVRDKHARGGWIKLKDVETKLQIIGEPWKY